MPNPFPGMNPYLEVKPRWKAIHHALITTLMCEVNAVLPVELVSTTEERVFFGLPNDVYPDVLLARNPDEYALPRRRGAATAATDAAVVIADPSEEVTEPFIEVRVAGAEETVVTVIEVVSPSNKRRESEGRDSYRQKQRQILYSTTHLIEIDLLRDGEYTVAAPRQGVENAKPDFQYLTSLHRVHPMRAFQAWLTTVRERLPRFAVPLTRGFADIAVDLQACLERVYEGGALERRIDYRKEPDPPLPAGDAVWADGLLRGMGLR